MSGSLVRRLPEGRLGQLLCVCVTLGALALLWFGAASPLLALYAERNQTLAARAAVLGHMQDIAADLPALHHLLARAKAARAADAASPLLDGETDAIAAANLQNIIQDLAAEAGLAPSSVEVLPAVQRGAFRRIGLQIETTASWPTLIATLKAMHDSTLALVVDDLTLHAIAVAGSGADAAHPALDASFMVFAFRAAPPGSERLPRAAALIINPTE